MVNHPPKKSPLASHLSDAQWRRRAARIRYDEIETAFCEEGLGDPALLYEEEKDLFRFAHDGVFAFSGERANWGELRRRGGSASSRPVGSFIALSPGPMPYASHDGGWRSRLLCAHISSCVLSLSRYSL
jgi:hypothetical protein